MPQFFPTFVLPALATAIVALGTLFEGAAISAEAAKSAPAARINTVILTGGHSFDPQEFLKVFQGHEDIAYTHLAQKKGGEVFDDIANWPYQVIVLYNFKQEITPKQQANFLKLLDKGVGLVILHHAVAAYVNWPAYKEIAGVEYHIRPWQKNGKGMPPSGYQHGVKFKVHVADRKHPITAGLADFEIRDETYCRSSISPSVHTLLTTDESSSDKTIGFIKTYANSRVCYLQSGHDAGAYRNPNYQTLVIRAIQWCGSPESPGPVPLPTVSYRDTHSCYLPNGTSYTSTITKEVRDSSPDWADSEPNPPVSARKAINLAEATLRSTLKEKIDPSFERSLVGVTLVPLGGKKWCWEVSYEWHRRVGGESGTPFNFEVFVLMNGTAIQPVREKQESGTE